MIDKNIIKHNLYSNTINDRKLTKFLNNLRYDIRTKDLSTKLYEELYGISAHFNELLNDLPQ